jgi:hypothetical protein
MNSKASCNAREQPEEAGDAVQPANRQLRPSRGDYSADSCVGHLPKYPDSIVERKGGRPAYGGTGEAEHQVQTKAEEGERHHRPAEPPNGASRHQRTSSRPRHSFAACPVAGLSRAPFGPSAPASSALILRRIPYPPRHR